MVGDTEIDETMMCVPIQYVKVHLVLDRDNIFDQGVVTGSRWNWSWYLSYSEGPFGVLQVGNDRWLSVM